MVSLISVPGSTRVSKLFYEELPTGVPLSLGSLPGSLLGLIHSATIGCYKTDAQRSTTARLIPRQLEGTHGREGVSWPI